MVLIDITSILSQDLTSRDSARRLASCIPIEADVVFDFRNVKFATRCFIDEFYNLFLKNPSDRTRSIKITNVPKDINTMIEAVSKTQNKVKNISETAHVKSFSTVDEFIQYMVHVNF
ncbi:MAG: hypothetical protein MJY46_00025 [Bacteroidales bacterium]|nr:hypothetical protein [Bacteroidales bacterium]